MKISAETPGRRAEVIEVTTAEDEPSTARKNPDIEWRSNQTSSQTSSPLMSAINELLLPSSDNMERIHLGLFQPPTPATISPASARHDRALVHGVTTVVRS
ncbi:hypothetical protein ACLKA6_014503 [Drosophila palustris]